MTSDVLPLLLTLTHLLAAMLGALIAWRLTLRYVRVREVQGHTALEFAQDDDLDPST